MEKGKMSEEREDEKGRRRRGEEGRRRENLHLQDILTTHHKVPSQIQLFSKRHYLPILANKRTSFYYCKCIKPSPSSHYKSSVTDIQFDQSLIWDAKAIQVDSYSCSFAEV